METSRTAFPESVEQPYLESEILEYMDVMCAVAWQITGNLSVVGQLVTETIVAALREPSLRQPQAPVKPWLLTKMRQLYLVNVRAKRRVARRPIPAVSSPPSRSMAHV